MPGARYCLSYPRCVGTLTDIHTPDGGKTDEYVIRRPDKPYRDYALKWGGEWQITYETFRVMGAAYAAATC